MWLFQSWTKRFGAYLKEFVLERAWDSAGGRGTYEGEQIEIAEREAALPVQHALIKRVFRIEPWGSFYDTTQCPHPQMQWGMAWGTMLHPLPAEFESEEVDVREVLGDGINSTVIYSKGHRVHRKSYVIEPKIYGMKFVDDSAIDHGRNISPAMVFMYYDRNVKQEGRYKKGIETKNPQFVVTIHDGWNPLKRKGRTYGGVDVGEFVDESSREPKGTSRVCLLGEVSPQGDIVNIRRVILDGKEITMTRENVALALAYTENLALQMATGKYDPASAMLEARLSTQHGLTRSPPQLGRT